MTKKTHILANDDKNYLGAWDLPEKDDIILTIDRIGWETVKNPKKNTSEKKRVLHFKETKYKPMIVNEINSAAIISSIKVSYMEDMGGHKIKLFKIWGKWFGKEGEAIRVRPTKVIVVKPVLVPGHKKWEQAKLSGMSIEAMRKHFEISDENYKLLNIKN